MLQEDDLYKIKNLCFEEYAKWKEDICYIILYGSAAKCYIGKKSDYSDFDINIFFKYSSKIKSTQFMPKRCDKLYKGEKVEIMRNKLKEGQSLTDFIKQQKSKRWDSIRTETKIKFYPGKIEPL